jgi:hypothetical protein
MGFPFGSSSGQSSRRSRGTTGHCSPHPHRHQYSGVPSEIVGQLLRLSIAQPTPTSRIGRVRSFAPKWAAHAAVSNLQPDPFFRTIDRLTTVGVEDYKTVRLRVVTRETLKKELPVLRRFARWAVQRGHLAKWETALRPQTIDQLRAPDDYRRGSESLLIRDEVDKNRFGRELPLSDAAREALNQVCPDAVSSLARMTTATFCETRRRSRASTNSGRRGSATTTSGIRASRPLGRSATTCQA